MTVTIDYLGTKASIDSNTLKWKCNNKVIKNILQSIVNEGDLDPHNPRPDLYYANKAREEFNVTIIDRGESPKHKKGVIY